VRSLIKPSPPRYDEVYFQGMRWLDWIARHEDKGLCVYFQDTSRGIECAAINCPCDLYEEEIVK
jgi:hypothetical protein